MKLVLTRTYFPEGTNGKLEYDGKLISNAIELPCRHNETKVSCILEGKYFIQKRYSSMFKWHLEVVNVPNRTLILFHLANTAIKEIERLYRTSYKNFGSRFRSTIPKSFYQAYHYCL